MEQRQRILRIIVQTAIKVWGLVFTTSLIFFLIGVNGRWILLAIGLIGLVFSVVYAYQSKIQVPQEMRVLIEVFGEYYKTLGPGLHIVPLWIAKTRNRMNTSTQRYPLFTEPIFIDFQDGSAAPKGVMAFVRMMNETENDDYQENIGNRVREEHQLGDYIDRDPAYRMKYAVRNIKEAVTSLLENSTRSYLNSLTIQEGIQAGRAGYNILPSLANHGEIVETLANWGLVLEKITVGDFDLSKTIIQDREAVHKAMQEEKAMEFLFKKRAKEIYLFTKALSQATGKTMSEVKQAISDNPELRSNFATFVQDVITRHISLDSNALTDIRVSGGSPLGETIIQAIAAFRQLGGRQE